jgi:FkbM family methyltransferase
MLSKIKNKLRDLGLKRYLKRPYELVIKLVINKPYWFLRPRLYPKNKQNIAGVDVQFVVEGPQDTGYHEFESELPIIKDLLSEIDDADVFFDIGANIGLYSCVISQKIDPKNVAAFEPSPSPYKKLQKNSKFNGHFHHHQVAISDTDEMIEFSVDVNDAHSRMSTINTNSSATDYQVREVTSRKLSSVVKNEDIPLPTIVKVDVEGAEFKVLKGIDRLLDSIQIIYCEIHYPALDGFNTDGEEIIEYLESSGFEVQTLHQRGDNEFIKATRIQGES